MVVKAHYNHTQLITKHVVWHFYKCLTTVTSSVWQNRWSVQIKMLLVKEHQERQERLRWAYTISYKDEMAAWVKYFSRLLNVEFDWPSHLILQFSVHHLMCLLNLSVKPSVKRLLVEVPLTPYSLLANYKRSLYLKKKHFSLPLLTWKRLSIACQGKFYGGRSEVLE